MTAPFITVQDLSNKLGRDVTADAGALFAVEAACDICRALSGQDFMLATETIRLDGSGSDVLLLPQRPVSGAGTVLVNGQPETAFEFTANGMLLRGSAGSGWAGWGGFDGWGGWRPVWPRGRLNVTVTYDHGYGAGAFPNSLKQVALNIAARSIVQGAAMAETVGAVSVRYAVSEGDLDKNELRILQRYRQASS